MLTNSLKHLDTTKIDQQANLLANEGMQLFFHHRDNNLHEGYPRNYFPDKNNKENYFWNEGATTFKIWFQKPENNTSAIFLENTKIKDNFDDNLKEFSLSFLSGEGYSRYQYKNSEDSDTSPIQFARYLLITGVVEDGKILDKNQILKIEAHVLYKKLWSTGEVVLESLIWNKGY